jgi:hypothetical protein
MKTKIDKTGSLTITATTPVEVERIQKLFDVFDTSTPDGLIAYASALKKGKLTHKAKNKFAPASAEFSGEWVRPYIKHLETMTGYNGTLDGLMIELPELDGYKHTHIVTRATFNGTAFKFEGYGRVFKEEKRHHETDEQFAKRAAARPVERFRQYCLEEISTSEPVPEYIQHGNGMFSPNPKWGTGHRNPDKPCLALATVANALVQWWHDNHATPGQRELMRLSAELQGPEFSSWHARQGYKSCNLWSYGDKFSVLCDKDAPGAYPYSASKFHRLVSRAEFLAA